jgi:hypothetical protein
MHFNFSLGTFHEDIVNPWFAPIGSFLHLGVDVIGGAGGGGEEYPGSHKVHEDAAPASLFLDYWLYFCRPAKSLAQSPS